MVITRGRGYTEDAAVGTTTNDYVSVLALDTRGCENVKIVVKNTHGSNSLTYKILVKHADYAGGTDDEDVAATELAAGNEAVASYVQGYSKITVQVKSTSSGSHATYEIEYLIKY